MTNYVSRGGLSIAAELSQFVNNELLAGIGITPDQFWDGFDSAVHALAPRNRELLAMRDDMQQKIDSWLRDNASSQLDSESYTSFLREIGYLVDEGPSFQIDTQNVDPEIASIAGPQLVVPITNARYALNAANARYGSLYDAFYGTDAIPSDGESGGKGYDPIRGAKVIARVRSFLDETLPLTSASWNDISGLSVVNGKLELASDDGSTSLADAAGFVGYDGDAANPTTIILRNNGLHLLVKIDASGAIGRDDKASINDVIAESAMSSIMDCEDSVACVDAEDKVLAYRNWLGLMKGTLEESFEKGGKVITRRLADDVAFTAANGETASLKGRALMLVRNVGHLMTNPAIRLSDGSEVPEGHHGCLHDGGWRDARPEGGS